MKFIILVSLLFVAAASAAPVLDSDYLMVKQWGVWKNTHSKVYDEISEVVRYGIWKSHMRLIEEHNAKNKSFTLAMNQFGDMTNEEFRSAFTGLTGFGKVGAAPSTHVHSGLKAPLSVDWRNEGLVTEVKDQGQCGSCWAFSTTGSVEGAHAKATGSLVSLSEQNLVDCATESMGCNGGLMDYGFDYIIQNGGIDTEVSYPYTAAAGYYCRYNSGNSAATISSYSDITSYSESDLLDAAANVGPVSVAIDASRFSFQFYSSGVYDEPSCSQYALDHGVLVVGYGTLDGQDYWVVKNSWGTVWGDSGYILMSRNKNNQCGIATRASYPIV